MNTPSPLDKLPAYFQFVHTEGTDIKLAPVTAVFFNRCYYDTLKPEPTAFQELVFMSKRVTVDDWTVTFEMKEWVSFDIVLSCLSSKFHTTPGAITVLKACPGCGL